MWRLLNFAGGAASACEVLDPKNKRKGHDFAFRINVAEYAVGSRTSKSGTQSKTVALKFLVDAPSAADRVSWYKAFDEGGASIPADAKKKIDAEKKAIEEEEERLRLQAEQQAAEQRQQDANASAILLEELSIRLEDGEPDGEDTASLRAPTLENGVIRGWLEQEQDGKVLSRRKWKKLFFAIHTRDASGQPPAELKRFAGDHPDLTASLVLTLSKCEVKMPKSERKGRCVSLCPIA